MGDKYNLIDHTHDLGLLSLESKDCLNRIHNGGRNGLDLVPRTSHIRIFLKFDNIYDSEIFRPIHENREFWISLVLPLLRERIGFPFELEGEISVMETD